MYLYYVIKSVREHTHQPRERFTLFQSHGLFPRHSLKSIDNRRSARFSRHEKKEKRKDEAARSLDINAARTHEIDARERYIGSSIGNETRA